MFCMLIAVTRRHWSLCVTTSLLVASFHLLVVSTAWASGPQLVQVEEDWELIVADPHAGTTSPQVTCTISPRGDLNNLHSVLELNHKTTPSFSAGGAHLQLWTGDYNLTRRSTESTAKLAQSGEVITWTSRMKLQNYALTFSVVNGQSSSWDCFGPGLSVTYGTSLVNLNDYWPENSVRNSGIGFGANRVKSLILKRVRYTTADGTTVTDHQQRIVHRLSN